jgi:hypothetical protein
MSVWLLININALYCIYIIYIAMTGQPRMIVLLDMNTVYWLQLTSPAVLKGILSFFSSYLMTHVSPLLSIHLFSSSSKYLYFSLIYNL